jgi:UDP-N-acetylglucosamine 2-epimerase (non-hydrolysing)
MKKLKVITVIGTRPEIIRLSRVIAALDIYCEHILVHTGQNYDYELNQVFFDDLDIRRPDYFLNSAEVNNGAAQMIGNLIIAVDKVLAEVQPEAMLVLGDTNSCLSVIAAKRRKISIFHMEAGNRCFDMRVPEEINRRIIDHTADVNLTYSSIAREYLLSEGLPADLVIKTGSPMFEVLNYYKSKIQNSEILKKLKIEKKGYFLISAHREENIDSPKNFSGLINILNFLAEEYQVPVIVSTHPRTQKKIDQEKLKLNQKVQLLKPLGFSDYVKLQVDAKVVLSDSGTINEESSILNFPALNLRDAHERPEAMEETSVMMVGMSVERVHQALDVLKNQSQDQTSILRQVSDYCMPNVSEKIVRIILSYTDYVNRVVWKKY